MKIHIRSNGVPITEELRKHIERTFTFTVDAFKEHLDGVSLFLADLNGPRGGADKLCQATAYFRNGKVARIRQTGTGVEAAVKHAADRLKHGISRTLSRTKRPIRVLSMASVRSSTAPAA